eukprot:748112-Hanusia_phi.AAC.2
MDLYVASGNSFARMRIVRDPTYFRMLCRPLSLGESVEAYATCFDTRVWVFAYLLTLFASRSCLLLAFPMLSSCMASRAIWGVYANSSTPQA